MAWPLTVIFRSGDQDLWCKTLKENLDTLVMQCDPEKKSTRQDLLAVVDSQDSGQSADETQEACCRAGGKEGIGNCEG